MPAPEPTWAQKAQRCQAALDQHHDELERLKGIEDMLRQANERIRQMDNFAVDVSGLSREIEFWKREAEQAKQAQASLQGRVQRAENGLRELKPMADMLPVVEEAAAKGEQDARQARQEAEACRRQSAGLATRVQQLQSATEALKQIEGAADQWQRRATQLERENNELRQELSLVPEMQQELAFLREKRTLAADHIQQTEARLAEAMPAARALPTVKADLVQKTEALESAQRRVSQLQRDLDQVRFDRAELAGLRDVTADQTRRLAQAAAELERKDRELAAANAEVRRLTIKLNDARTQLG